MRCPACSGEGILLGSLGAREHFRCRACGADFSSAPEHADAPAAARPTRSAFLETYRAELLARYGWAGDPHRLSTFMASVTTTLNTKTASWNSTGEAVEAAWKKIGGKGKATYKALRALEN